MDLSRLAVHTITNRPWSPRECIEHYAEAGVRGITFWRRDFEGVEPDWLGKTARDAGLVINALARGGFFTSEGWWDDNRRALEEAAAAGAPQLVLVCGGCHDQTLETARAVIAERLATLLPLALAAGVKLALEPLHPMYAAERSALNTIAQAHALCEALGSPSGLGIAVDVYHTWWDPDLEPGIERAAQLNRLFAVHVCDWITPTTDLLNDRGLMGEGCIPLRTITAACERAGFGGFYEVEIFSNRWWATPQEAYLSEITRAFSACL